ncbi:MAG TPA: DUF2804 domain-containing protein [Aquabacterium sp.]|nr:DUF2804 domain-containing protein [Aquabacterium sp.]
MMSLLPLPPVSLVESGQARHGRYAGLIDRLDWSDLDALQAKSAWWRRCHHKRWQYVGIGCDEVFIGMAIVDVGWCQTAFAYVFDRRERKLLADWSADGLPGVQGGVSDEPVMASRSWFRSFGASLSIQAVSEVLQVHVRAGGIEMQAQLSLPRTAPFLLAVGPIEQGLSHATQKSPALPVDGWLKVKGQRFSLRGAMGCLDSSNGLLARETAWRWACAQSPEVGFNLQDGYFGSNENALWLDGQLIPLARAHFEFQADQPMRPWRVWTDDGLLDLTFEPEGARQQNRNLLIAASYYIQPIGTFHGWVKAESKAAPRAVDRLVGVTEDHRSRW